ncbi:aminotransferase class I/II-fold pyridoxal phosphate-dependent enzyme [Burkholderia metallica]|uniref:aminotransferase class I/II-fold pyridoxal phosphate-dependent enzyme n=1 Tax=Burkholderia metallica TaxID=488729 RepID=UPI001CF143FC|nr:aminotransferase class I/II-fold pyridoxal phosphate-dependent enzyme [Burkholderia metallica]MCA8022647.1 aminotransferase class I/II-fold pyridoxal phosphate-dependent enzyme [Burkholderia metallica]
MTPTEMFIDATRPEVRALPVYNAGLSADHVRARFGVERVAKLGSNENPFGASARVGEALARALADGVSVYPDPACSVLRAALAARLAIDGGRLCFGNGSEDLLSVAAHAFLAPGDEVVTVAPSFGLHVICPQSVGATVEAVPMRDLAFDVDALCSALTPRTRMLIISNPSNPVGCAIDAGQIRRLLSHVLPGTLVLWDEAYYEYARVCPDYADCLTLLARSGLPWLLLRTFSKAYGLAGMRIGYGVASDARLVHLLNRVRTPFNINHLAQCAAVAALSDVEHVAISVEHVTAERERMRAALVALGYAPARSHANFLFFDAHEDAAALSQRLLSKGVIVKPWREPGYERCLRVSIGAIDDNDLFVDTLASVRGDTERGACRESC